MRLYHYTNELKSLRHKMFQIDNQISFVSKSQHNFQSEKILCSKPYLTKIVDFAIVSLKRIKRTLVSIHDRKQTIHICGNAWIRIGCMP